MLALIFLSRFKEKSYTVEVAIPVKPYTLKFLQRHLATPYKLSRVDQYGMQLFYMLRSPRTDARFDLLMKQYESKFVFTIDPVAVIDGCMLEGVSNFTSAMTNDFNSWVERIFKHEFHTYVQVNSDCGVPVFTAIRQYCDIHNLTEEDISQETLRTSYKRYLKKWLKKQENQPNQKKSSSPLNQAA